jgi:hypothetical protein
LWISAVFSGLFNILHLSELFDTKSVMPTLIAGHNRCVGSNGRQQQLLNVHEKDRPYETPFRKSPRVIGTLHARFRSLLVMTLYELMNRSAAIPAPPTI